MENLLFLDVPVLKHFTVALFCADVGTVKALHPIEFLSMCVCVYSNSSNDVLQVAQQ